MTSSIRSWSPLLFKLDPEALVISQPFDLPSPSLSVSTVFVPSSLFDFTRSWNRLRSIEMYGEDTVPVVKVEGLEKEDEEDEEEE